MNKVELDILIAECVRIGEPCFTYETSQRVAGSRIEYSVDATMHWPSQATARGVGKTLGEAIADCAKNLRLTSGI
jgi:hypothetical protein